MRIQHDVFFVYFLAISVFAGPKRSTVGDVDCVTQDCTGLGPFAQALTRDGRRQASSVKRQPAHPIFWTTLEGVAVVVVAVVACRSSCVQ